MISVKQFRKGTGRYITGMVEVQYWDMILFCEIVILKTRDGVYVKIPQRYDQPTNGRKINILFWVTPEVSKAFQDEVKAQLLEKFPEALQIPEKKDVKRNIRNFQKENKKFGAKKEKIHYERKSNVREESRNANRYVVEKQNVGNFLPGKARNSSKFFKR